MGEFEEWAAAVHCHTSPLEFYELPMEVKARMVAFYRLSRLVEIHSEDAVSAAAERMAAKRR